MDDKAQLHEMIRRINRVSWQMGKIKKIGKYREVLEIWRSLMRDFEALASRFDQGGQTTLALLKDGR